MIMTKINFDEPSVGNVRVVDANGLEVRVKGKGSQGILGYADGFEPSPGLPEQPQGGVGVTGISERERKALASGESQGIAEVLEQVLWVFAKVHGQEYKA